jgi:hypothetical protein
MSWTASSRICVSALWLGALAGCAGNPRAGAALYSDDFANLDRWTIEAEQPAKVSAHDGTLDIDTPAGITLWFEHRLDGAVQIEFEARAVSAGGVNDQVSDLNAFWMANNADGKLPVYARKRSGKFADYDDLTTYYVGLGGNRNTTSRFRRYVGEPGNRPLLPQHDLTDKTAMLVPNQWQKITLIANGSHIEFRRDAQPMFRLEDKAPYTSGWFALRTTWSHFEIRHFRVRRPD